MKTSSNKVYFLIIGVVAILLIAGIGFLVLHKNSSSTSVLSANSTNQNPANQRFGRSGGGRGFRGNLPAGATPIFGQITNVTDNSITVSGRNGDLNVVLNASTKYTGGTKSDLKANDRVFGYGTSNSDGSITAQQITINPSFPGRQGGSNQMNQNPQTNSQSL